MLSARVRSTLHAHITHCTRSLHSAHAKLTLRALVPLCARTCSLQADFAFYSERVSFHSARTHLTLHACHVTLRACLSTLSVFTTLCVHVIPHCARISPLYMRSIILCAHTSYSLHSRLILRTHHSTLRVHITLYLRFIPLCTRIVLLCTRASFHSTRTYHSVHVLFHSAHAHLTIHAYRFALNTRHSTLHV